ncbi:MAG TPA: ATP-binding protein, partial [Candidatus Marinimicrobia bacterium]|nr:ATP-binding protein [Candidatus Neomarinimicrobiota bacterium]
MMDQLSPELLKSLGKVIDVKILDTINQKLSLYTVGTNRLLFDLSQPVRIEDLLGIGSEKTRISIIYLNTLHSSEEKEFVIATITEMLYQWMLKNPPTDKSKDLQCAYYIDEIAPYIPPVRKPACKESLTVLYKQARKYGVGCIIATQNPGDIDYKSIAQFSTMALGSIYTQQDIKKVRNRLDSLAPKEADIISSQLSALEKGHFILLAPETKKEAIMMNSRWLVTQHKVLTETDIESLTPDAIRQSFLQKNAETAAIQPESPSDPAPVELKAADDEILVVKLNFYEKDLSKEIKSHLASGLFKNKEKSSGAALKYLPII